MSSTDEEWRAVVGWEGLYEVSSYGAVRSIDRITTNGSKRRGKLLKSWDIGNGHRAILLYRGSKRSHQQVHRLVAAAFIPNPENHPIVRHWDDVPDNNHVSNLRWGTLSENSFDAIRNGNRTYSFAEKTECVNGHEFTEENSFYRPNRRHRECRQCMRDRSNKNYWANKSPEEAFKRLPKNTERYRQAEEMVAKGSTISEIMRILHMDFNTIKKYFPNAGKTVGSNGGLTLDRLDPEKFRLMGEMVAAGNSLAEIMRTLHVDHRTIKRHFPNAGWGVGGGGKAAEAREVNRKLRDLDGHGMVKKNRDAGFNLRGGR